MSEKRQVNLKASQLVLDSTFHKLTADQIAAKYGITRADVNEYLGQVGLRKTRKPVEKEYEITFEMDLEKRTSQNVDAVQTPIPPPYASNRGVEDIPASSTRPEPQVTTSELPVTNSVYQDSESLPY
jgi:hypothetical protein